jgi:hypothetical protein
MAVKTSMRTLPEKTSRAAARSKSRVPANADVASKPTLIVNNQMPSDASLINDRTDRVSNSLASVHQVSGHPASGHPASDRPASAHPASAGREAGA